MRDQVVAIAQEAIAREQAEIEIIGPPELAKRLGVPTSWVQERTRNRTKDTIPHYKFGKYVRFAWGSPELAEWLRGRMVVSDSTVERAYIKEKTR